MNEERPSRFSLLMRVLLAGVFLVSIVIRYENSVMHAQDGERDHKPAFEKLSQFKMPPGGEGITIDGNSPDAINRLNELVPVISSMPATADGHPSSSMEVNSIANGDFEQGRVAWVEGSLGGFRLIYPASDLPVPPHSGNWAAWLGGPPENVDAIKQQVTVPHGATLRYWVWIVSNDVCGQAVGGALINGTPVKSSWLCADNNTGGWVHLINIDVSAYWGQSVELAILAGLIEATGESHMFIDDVEFYVESGPTCYTLTRNHTGNGSDPVASPAKSSECPSSGHYVAGESINLTASPAAGSAVTGWTGTINDSSTSTSNSVTMPASDHAISVHYGASVTCYELTLAVAGSGSGAVPVASPTASSGCAEGEYVEGAIIGVTAAPDPGSKVERWYGTIDDSSTSTQNTVNMPGEDHRVSVEYEDTCRRLWKYKTGAGAHPTIDPSASDGCDEGKFFEGEVINLTAQPYHGGTVLRWRGTDHDESTSTNNTVTMPEVSYSHTVQVYYSVPCHELDSERIGSGQSPTRDPIRSDGCLNHSFIRGEVVTLTARPDAGATLLSWQGTDDDTSTAEVNTVTMPDSTHTITATYSTVCYALTLTHSGSGANLVANPPASENCDPGSYVVDASITLTATPDSGANVLSWAGTEDDTSTATTNTVTMPGEDHTVKVNYSFACHQLTLAHHGEGAVPKAEPSKSGDCTSNGDYLADEKIRLTADPARGWMIEGWWGTDDDNSKEETNEVTMPPRDHTVEVTYGQPIIYLPIIFRQ